MSCRSVFRVVSLSFLFAVGAGIPAAVAAPTTSATVKAAHDGKYGTLLVSSSGLTLYQLATEKTATIRCTGACAKVWPPLMIGGGAKPKAGPGVAQAKLGTIRRPDGGTQVTYNGKALYRFASDTKAGAVGGQNIDGFHVVALSASSASGAKPATTPAGSGGYGGY
jgi:predicted lipoprotein with Yx(FWY)xxD motif